jgi:2-polyprenyl-3-methyl-5-hydroxy-6-metoxy-1,4-benzoquinol methylase/uncharacterized protein YbaR (Trm112 family)
MKRETLHLIRCPNCKHELTLHEKQADGNEVVEGILECRSCGKSFDITGSVPRMAVSPDDREDVAKSWGYQWSKVTEGKLETDTYYGETEEEEMASFLNYMGITTDDLRGKRVLDAGCGCGRLTKSLGRYGAEVIGIDIATSIECIQNYCRPEPTVDIIQADITAPPFPDASFDYISCKLVLCYVAHPEETFKTLARLVKPGGRLFISMPDKEDPAFTVRLKNALRITHRLPKWLLLDICWGLAPALWLARKLSSKQGNSLRTNVFLLFNALHAKFTYHTTGEVIAWFKEGKFDQITKTPGMLHSVNIRGTRANSVAHN